MLTLRSGPDPALCRPSKISDSYNKFHIDRILEDKISLASQMCDTIAINAKLPKARLIINRVTMHINAAREILWDNFYNYIGNKEGNFFHYPKLATSSEGANTQHITSSEGAGTSKCTRNEQY